MPKYMAVHVVVLAGLVVAVTLLVFQSRALTFRLQALEAARASAPTVPTESPVLRDSPSDQDPRRAFVEKAAPLSPYSDPIPSPGAPTPGAPAVAAPLTPAQDLAVANSVDRILKEKYGHLPKAAPPEDLEKILERELNLTASQKERIAAILKKKGEESASIFRGGNPFSGKNLQKAMELDAHYDTAIKNELDATQQARYDQLKKDGKINSGITIRIDAGGDEE